MNIADIKELAAIMDKSGLSRIEIEEDGKKIKMCKEVQVVAAPVAVPTAVSPASNTVNNSIIQLGENVKAEELTGNYVKSPTVGVFYSAASPDSKPYVSVGAKVKAGDVLCIIEAMKLMNEIQADMDGEIEEVLVGNGQVVEFDQPLFKLKTNN